MHTNSKPQSISAMESAENQDRSPKTDRSEASQDSTSLSKIETIKLLNDSIDRLESTIKDISQNSAKKLPSSDSIESLLNTTQKLADSVAPPPVTAVEETTVEEITIEETETTAEKPPSIPTIPVSPATPATSKTESTLIETSPIPPAEIKSKPTVKNPLKKTVVKQPKRANRGLIALGAAAIAITLIALAWMRYPQIKAAVTPSPKTTEIVAIDENKSDRDSSLPEAIENPVANPDIAVNPKIEEPVVNTPATETEPEIESPIIPQDLASPGRIKNLKIETIEPELTFTPEQTLVGALQRKLVEVTEDYDSDLYNNILVDLPKTSLLIEVTDNWYKLNESRQIKLANDILKRSRQLNFSKLQLQDSTGTLVARNPVVGDRIIILQTSKDN